MKKITQTIKKALLAGTLAWGLYASPVRAEEPKVNFGYNALETAVVTERTPEGDRPVRNRLLSDVSLDIGDFTLGYQGLNEFNNWDSDTYFGRNRFMLGKNDLPLKLLVDTKANSEEIFDTKFGVRYTDLVKKLGGYGYTDVSANQDALNLTMFYGRPLGKGFSAEILQDCTFSNGEKPAYFTELQLNKNITENLSLFGRAEIPNFDKDLATYLVGVSIKF